MFADGKYVLERIPKGNLDFCGIFFGTSGDHHMRFILQFLEGILKDIKHDF